MLFIHSYQLSSAGYSRYLPIYFLKAGIEIVLPQALQQLFFLPQHELVHLCVLLPRGRKFA